jgi:hypothetical protein
MYIITYYCVYISLVTMCIACWDSICTHTHTLITHTVQLWIHEGFAIWMKQERAQPTCTGM